MDGYESIKKSSPPFLFLSRVKEKFLFFFQSDFFLCTQKLVICIGSDNVPFHSIS